MTLLHPVHARPPLEPGPPDAGAADGRPAGGSGIAAPTLRMRLYVGAIILAGAAAVALSVHRLDLSQPLLFVTFVILSSLCSAIKLPLPLARGGSSLSLCFAVDVASLLFLGPYAATLVVTVSAWSQCSFRMRERNPWYRTLFSMATLALSMQAGGQVFTLLGDGQQTIAHGLIVPLAAAALVYLVSNTGLIATAIAFSTGQAIARVWRESFLWSAPSYFMGAACAALAEVVLAQQTDPLWIVLIVVPAVLTYRSYRLFIGRIETEQAEVRRASQVQLATIEALALAIEARDSTSPMQVRKMQAYAAGLARAVGMPEIEILGLQTATLLHDIGNLAVPEHIFSKPGPLTFEEFQKVKTHPLIGAEILKDVPFPYPVASLIACHHEHWDGNGYPQGLRGEQIPLGARILAVVDSYTALTSQRPHRPARAYHEAVATLRQTAGSILDPRLVELFIDALPMLDFQFANSRTARAPAGSAPADPAGTSAGGGSALEDIAGAHQEARALYQIAQALGASLGISESMGLIAENLKDLVPFSCSALFLANDETGRFECRWASGLANQAVRQISVEALDEIERLQPEEGPEATPAFRSSIAARLVFNEAVIGALAVFHEEADAYSSDRRRVFQRVAEHAALVIRNSVVFERTQQDSFTDQLTQLPNRRYMLLYLKQQMARAQQHQSKLAVVLIDLNDFKEINDTLGHQAGDRALHEVAAVLQSMVRSYDLCVRYGGDEFVVILWECDAEQAEYRRREMEGAIAAMFFEGGPGQSRRLSMSSGVAVYPEDGQTHEELPSRSITAGSSPITLVVTGSNFLTGSVVRWNLSDRATTYVSDTVLRAVITLADLAAAGTASVMVWNPPPGGGISIGQTFTINAINPVPTITTLNPASVTYGGPAFVLDVVGNNFVPGTVLRWNGSARPTTVVNSTEVRADISAADIASVGSVVISLFNPAPQGGESNPLTFSITYVHPAPTLTSLNPTSKPAGSANFQLILSGTNFVVDSKVRWNGQDRTTTYVSDTELRAAILSADLPAVGTASVTVYNPPPGGGTSGSLLFTIDNPLPAITSLTPSTVTAGSAALTLTVKGINFVNGSVVRWNGANRTTTFVSTGQLTAVLPSSDFQTAQIAQVTVVNLPTGGGTSNPEPFSVTNQVPAISGITPAAALVGTANVAVVINGSKFIADSKARWNGQERTTTYVNSSQLRMNLNASDLTTAGTFLITVANPDPGGGTSTGQTFTVNNPLPSVTSITPSSTTVGSDLFTLTVNGANLINGSVVRWNGADLATTYVSSGKVTAAVPAKLVAAVGGVTVTVFNATPGGGLSNGLPFQINNPVPAITNYLRPPAQQAAAGSP